MPLDAGASGAALEPSPRDRARRGVAFGVLRVLALAVFSFCVSVMRGRLGVVPSYEEAGIAVHLLHGEGFASPLDFRPHPIPTCFCAPVYPLIIAAAYRLSPSHGNVILLALNALCYGIVGAVIYRIFACGASRTVGVLALLGYAAHPFIVFWSGNYWDSYVALAMFFCALRIATILPRIHRTAGVCGAMGGLLGFLSLTNASWLLSYPLLILYGLRGRPISTRLAGVAAAALAWGIVLTPWTIRNYVVFHRLFYVRGDLGFELDSGNHPYATGWIDPELADFNPYFNTQLRNQVLSLGEMRFYDQCAAEFRRHYAADRGAFWDRVLRRAVYIFLSDPTQAPSDVPLMGHRRVGAYYLDRLLLHAAVATLGLAGVWTAWRLKLGLAWIAPVALATQLPLLVTFVDDRYVLPLRIVLTSFAAVLIWAVGFRLLHKRWPATATQSAGSPQASVAT